MTVRDFLLITAFILMCFADSANPVIAYGATFLSITAIVIALAIAGGSDDGIATNQDM